MTKILPAICIAFALAGCSGGGIRVVTVCPTAEEYSAETQAKAAKELVAIKDEAPTIYEFMDDYGALRRQVRACKEEPKDDKR